MGIINWVQNNSRLPERNVDYHGKILKLVDKVVDDSDIVVARYYMNIKFKTKMNFLQNAMRGHSICCTLGVTTQPDASAIKNTRYDVFIFSK